ncbi:TlpA family protein disulfide reductase [Pinibacter aurantiacus]|uniref:TlpA family protein disulfide reductase n=1 Tax=Pinibacter aurantiacus TaxID=2851599 RepID=A0A9E2W802_9BACT|nr:TlpA disulfide reductase family protein [Pinibacter aurantiacus]MBV4357242.1 TlpA family protein disulfide reductase [Pinibacter aurantiacus]
MTQTPFTLSGKLLIAIIFLSLCVTQRTTAQKKFSLTIVADSSIDVKGLHCQYYNGFGLAFVPDTFTGNKITLTDEYISKYAAVDISYNNHGDFQGGYTFFIDEEPATIHIGSVKDGTENKLRYSKLENATDFFDTSTNFLLKELREFRKDEDEALSRLWANHNYHDITYNDSLRALNEKLLKAGSEKNILFIKKHPEEYFSFYWFQDQVVGNSLEKEKDTAYLRSLVTTMTEIFPERVVSSAEGQWLIVRINAALYPPPQKGMPVPDVQLRDINGKSVKLSDFKGRYVLLDFWASWCPPCRKNGPVLKTIAAQYKKNLQIVGISIDNNLTAWRDAIKEDGLTWVNLCDAKLGNNSAAMHYKITSVPHYFLIDASGKLIMETSGDLEAIKSRLRAVFP